MNRHFHQLILTVILLMTVSVASAQKTPEFVQTLKQFLIANGGLASQQESQLANYTTMAQALLPAEQQHRAGELARQYLQSQYLDDVADMNADYYLRIGVIQRDLTYLIEQYSTDEAKLAVQHSIEFSKKVETDMAQAVSNYVMSNGINKVEPQQYPDIYRKSVQAFYKGSGLKDNMEAILINLINTLSQQGGQEGTVALLNRFITEEVETLIANSAYGILTEEDFNVLGRIQNTPQQKLVNEGSTLISKDLTNVGSQVIMKFSAWLSKNI